jgi:hypothetical protein
VLFVAMIAVFADVVPTKAIADEAATPENSSASLDASNSRAGIGDCNQLENQKLRAQISHAGALVMVENRLAAEAYGIDADAFEIDTDLGILTNQNAKPVEVQKLDNGIAYRFVFDHLGQSGTSSLGVTLTYTLGPDNAFFRRVLKIANHDPIRLKNVRMGRTIFREPAEEVVHYLTFWMAPTVEFIRHHAGGMFTGIENPFYHAELDVKGMALNFEPGLILNAGEGYESEPQFLGVYKKSGVMIEDSDRPFRYPNASGYIPIDRNESRAMRAFALDYLAPVQNTVQNINYQFFHPLPQKPTTEDDKRYFLKTIDTFADIGGDMIIFRPLHPYRKPDAVTPFWNVIPDDKNATARQIADYARQKGISYGFYMGCAAHGNEGNAAGLPFRPDRSEWKKMDAAGRRAQDNCLGCDDFFSWWFQVQDTTIKKYQLSNWSWDPSLGSAMNCYDESHGHIAGQGAYKGWRRCIELAGRLKHDNPGLFIQGFYGVKHFGLWGMKHMDQHEVYNEQTACVCTHHTQISDDRQNADGLRFQNYWCMRFRFLPTVMGHALVHRMCEGPFDRELIKAWDFYGWRYGLMSALAVSGSVMPAILPYESDLVPGYKEFYRKWTRWAADNFEYIQYTEPFGEQVQPGTIDGYARIKGDHGFVFLFNGNPRPSQIRFEVGDEINLQAAGNYEFVELYPAENPAIVLDDLGRSVFALGQQACMTIPANACKLIELRRMTKTADPVLVGVSGQATLNDEQLQISSVEGRPGQLSSLRVRLLEATRVTTVSVNGVPQAFSREGNEIQLAVQFAGDSFVRELDHWTKPDGAAFQFPNTERQEALELKTNFKINEETRNLLEQAKPKNFAEMSSKIAAWQANGQGSYDYHNFTCCRPDRLWLIIPFTLENVQDVKATVNGTELGPMLRHDHYGHSFYADVTDLVHYGADNEIILSMRNLESNEFMGPFLMYPDEGQVNAVLPKPIPTDAQPVVYTRSLIPPGPPRYLRNAKRPVITKASVAGNVAPGKATQLQVTIDLPPDQVQQVLYTESGFPWMGIHGLQYNPDLRCWTGDVTPGNRAAIQESEYLYIWAIDRNGLHSDYYPVKVGWDFP